MDVTLLLPLMDQAASFSVPCRLHPAVRSIGESAETWARQGGLVTGEAETAALGRARFGRLAARMFPDADEDRVTLFTRWLIWLFAFDDARDEGPLGRSATTVDAMYSAMIMALRRGRAGPGAGPLEVVLAELWQATATSMSRSWRSRFLGHLADHRAASGEEAVNRRTGQVPSMKRYPELRRRTSGAFMLDLAEPVLGAELPATVVRSPAWQNLLEGTADLVVWCNDVASYTREALQGATHNYATVLAHAFGLSPEQTGPWVVDRIAERAPEVQAAARQLPATLDRLGLDAAATGQIRAVAEILLSAPRAHLEWLLESGRYGAHGEFVPRQHSARSEPLGHLPRWAVRPDSIH